MKKASRILTFLALAAALAVASCGSTSKTGCSSSLNEGTHRHGGR